MDWTAFGSIGTFVAVLVGVAAIIIPEWAARRRRDEEIAAHLREVMRTYAASAKLLINELREGAFLFNAAGSTVDYIRRQLPAGPTRYDLWRYLDDQQNVMRAAISGFAAAPAASSSRRELQAVDPMITGGLGLLSTAGRLVLRAQEDVGYGLFMNVFEPEPLQKFKLRYASSFGNELLWSLATFLQANSALYFLARHDPALAELDTFVDRATSMLTRLDSKRLVRASRSKVEVAIPPTTLTAEMFSGIAALKKSGALTENDAEDLSAIIARIEKLLDKVTAAEWLDQFELAGTE